MEACKSGSFADELSSNTLNQKVAFIASSSANELSYIDNSGSISFTKLFADKLLAGNTINKSFSDAKTALATLGGVYLKQLPVMVASTDALKNITVGGSFAAASMNLTTITSVKANSLTNQNNLDLTANKTIAIDAEVSAGGLVSKAWATIITPDFTPPAIGEDYVTPDLTNYTINLEYDLSSKTYKGIYTLPSLDSYSGKYEITVNVEDGDGLVYSKTIIYNGIGNKDVSTIPTTLTCLDSQKLVNNICVAKTCEVDGYNCPQTETINLSLNNNWNLVALPINTTLSQAEFDSKFGNDSVIWTYNNNATNNKWSVHIGSSLVNSITLPTSVNNGISSIEAGVGFWVKSNGAKPVSFDATTNSPYKLTDTEKLTSASQGWHLLGTGTTQTTSEINSAKSNISIMWKYVNGAWQTTYSGQLPNGITSMSDVKAGEGVWVLIK